MQQQAPTGPVVGVPIGAHQYETGRVPPHQYPAARSDLESGFPEVMQLSCRDQGLPPDIRLAFVVKVYGIIIAMLCVTFGIAAPFVFLTDAAMDWMARHRWVLLTAVGILLAQYAFNACMMCQMCCGGSSLLRAYMAMFKTVPLNYAYLFTFAACFGVLVGYICAQYTVISVVLVFAITAVLILALTAFAVRTKADFTGMGGYILVLLLGLMIMLLVASFFPYGRVLYRVIGAAGAIVFGFVIVYDTQQIFGSASMQFGGGHRELEYTIDMYGFAAWNLYLDFINFFLYMLQFLGDRRD